MDLFLRFLSALWDTAQAMAPWLLFGFLAAGLLSLFFSPALVCRFLGRAAGKKAVALAVLLGVPLPLCSCGVLPLAASIKRSGASKGAMAAFLISTPQTGIDSFFATGSLLGWVFALVRPLVATLTGLAGGFAIQAIDNETLTTDATLATETPPQTSLFGKLLAALQYGYLTLLKGIAPALLIGLIISALILVFVPDSLFSSEALGNDWIAFPVMLLIGMPMYVCSTASIPVALALMEEVACYSADELGFGYAFIKPRGYAFMVTNVCVEFLTPVRLGDTVTVKTWPLPPTRVTFGREYQFELNGQTAINASSRWCLIDMKEGKLLQSKVIDNQDYSTYNTRLLIDPVEWKIPSFPKEEGEEKFSLKIANSEYDHNMHVNNTRYADYCMNVFSIEELQEKRVAKFSISYVKQCKEGETLRFYRREMEEGLYLILGVNEADEIVVQASILLV